MFKIRPEIAIGIKQVENGVKSTVGRHSSMSKYPGAGRVGYTHRTQKTMWLELLRGRESVAR